MPFFTGFSTNYKDRPLLFIDLEMTGLDHAKHEIIEIAALLVDQTSLEITNSYYTKVLPTHIATADPKALSAIGYDPKNWLDAIPLRQALLDLSALAPACFLAGFSVQNEWNFLITALEQEKLPYFFNNYLLEVWTLAFIKFRTDPRVTNLGMTNLCRLLNIPVDRHKPDSDIRATYEIFKLLIADGLQPTPHGPGTAV